MFHHLSAEFRLISAASHFICCLSLMISADFFTSSVYQLQSTAHIRPFSSSLLFSPLLFSPLLFLFLCLSFPSCFTSCMIFFISFIPTESLHACSGCLVGLCTAPFASALSLSPPSIPLLLLLSCFLLLLFLLPVL